MKRRSILAAAALVMALGAAQAARAECKQQLIATIPITFVNNQPMVEVSINGKPAYLRFSLSSRTWFWGSAARKFDLKHAHYEDPMVTYGPGGKTSAASVRIHELKLGDSVEKDKDFYLAPEVNNLEEAGVFGSGLFSVKNDIELDFAHEIVRVFKPNDCNDDDVVYWGGNYSVVAETKPGHIPIKLAGQTLDGSLDAGNEVTFVTLEGARRVGVPLRAAGPLPMGMLAGGMIKPIEVSIANFQELVIGDETIKNAPLAVGEIFPKNREDADGRPISHDFIARPEIILGADFARSHRIYISADQKKVYFSYVGGVLFQDIYARLGAEPPQAPKPEGAPPH
jgi:predicted aspartyl protease